MIYQTEPSVWLDCPLTRPGNVLAPLLKLADTSGVHPAPPPIPAQLTIAIGDMSTAFTNATGRVNPDFTNLAAGAICGLILAPGLYKWTTGVTMGCDITFSGSSTDTWILQVAGTLTVEAGAKMVLAGGAVASNIFWAVTGPAVVSAGAHTEGVILGKISCTYLTGASADGCLLCQTAVALQKATIHN